MTQRFLMIYEKAEYALKRIGTGLLVVGGVVGAACVYYALVCGVVHMLSPKLGLSDVTGYAAIAGIIVPLLVLLLFGIFYVVGDEVLEKHEKNKGRAK